MKKMSLVAMSEDGNSKFERPLVVGNRDVLILQYPHHYSEEQVARAIEIMDHYLNRLPMTDGITPVAALPDDLKLKVLRIDIKEELQSGIK